MACVGAAGIIVFGFILLCVRRSSDDDKKTLPFPRAYISCYHSFAHVLVFIYSMVMNNDTHGCHSKYTLKHISFFGFCCCFGDSQAHSRTNFLIALSTKLRLSIFRYILFYDNMIHNKMNLMAAKTTIGNEMLSIGRHQCNKT